MVRLGASGTVRVLRGDPQGEDLERSAPGDRYADYCLWDYPPVAPPAGKLRCANLLWRALAAAGAGPRFYEACRALRTGLGPFRTVFGVKQSLIREVQTVDGDPGRLIEFDITLS